MTSATREHCPAMTPFSAELKLELTLTLGSKAFSIPGGQVKHLASHGFNASGRGRLPTSWWRALRLG